MKTALNRLQGQSAALVWNVQQRLLWRERSQTLQAAMRVPHHQMNLVPCFTKEHRLSTIYICLFLFIVMGNLWNIKQQVVFLLSWILRHLQLFKPTLKSIFFPAVYCSELYALPFRFLITYLILSIVLILQKRIQTGLFWATIDAVKPSWQKSSEDMFWILK